MDALYEEKAKRYKHLSEVERGKIEAYLKAGWSIGAISKEIKVGDIRGGV